MAKSSRQLWANYVKRGDVAKVASGQTVLNTPSQFKGVILGVDPSLRGSGFAVLDYANSNAIRLIEASTLKLKPSISQMECLAAIGHQDAQLVYSGLQDAVSGWQLSVERILRGAAP